MKLFSLRSLWPWETNSERRKRHKELMTGLERLTAAVADNTKAVDELIAAWNKPDSTDEQLAALAVLVEANSARTRALFTPPAPTA